MKQEKNNGRRAVKAAELLQSVQPVFVSVTSGGRVPLQLALAGV